MTVDSWLAFDSGCVRQWRGCAGNKRAVTLTMLENCAGKVIYRESLNIIALSCLFPALHRETRGEGRSCLYQCDASEGNVEMVN